MLLPIEVMLLQSTTIPPLLSRVPKHLAEVACEYRVLACVVLTILIRPFVVLVSFALVLEDFVAHLTLVESHFEKLLLKFTSLL